MDGQIGHLRERIDMPHAKDVEVVERRLGEPGDLVFGGEPVPPMILFGSDQFMHVTGSTHKEDGMRDVSAQDVHDRLVRRLVSKIETDRDKLERVEERFTDDADFAVLSYGASARPALGAVLRARDKGMNAGFMRLISIWPFPAKAVERLGSKVDRIYVPEMNLGQMNREVERYVDCEVIPISKIGGVPHTVTDVMSVIEGGGS
jgi:2-oxoglutarate ferredoxin oxidoreductase subunit alpha